MTTPDTSNLLETYRVLFTLDDWSVDRTVLGTSGEDRVLVRDVVWFRTRDAADSEIESLNLYDVDDTGRIVHMISFAGDDLDAAWAELGAELHAGTQTLVARAVQRFSDAINAHDWDALVAVFAPGAQQIDRRSWISRGDVVDPVEMNRTLFSLEDWSTDDRLLETHGDRRALVRRVTRFRDGASGWAEVATLTVGEVDAIGRIVLHIGLDPDDIDAARAELRAVPAVPPPRENAAWQAALRMKAASEARDWDAFAALFAPECEVRSERHNAQLHLTGDEAPLAFRLGFDLEEFSWERSLVASRGDHLALTRDVVRFSDGAVGPGEVPLVSVVECAADGRIAGVVSFELEAVDAAMAELEARASRNATARFENEAWRAETRLWEACVAAGPRRVPSDGRRRVRERRTASGGAAAPHRGGRDHDLRAAPRGR